MKKIVYLSVFFLLIFFTGCATKSSLVLKDGYSFKEKPSINIDKITNNTSKIYKHNIEETMKEALIKEFKDNNLLALSNNSNIDLEVSILNYEEGNAFKRWLMPGWGATILNVEAILKENGNIIATSKINNNIPAGGAYTIGAWRQVFFDTAEKLVEDIQNEYKQKK